MKYLLYIISFLFLVSCQQEDFPTIGEGIGYLSLEDIQIQAAEVEMVQTRAVDNDLYVEIWQDGSLYDNHKYTPRTVPAKIELPAGTYTLKVYNMETYADGKPWYYGEQEFTIAEGGVNYLSYEVPLKNFGVKLQLPEGFEELFHDITFTVGEDVELDDGDVYYFAPNTESISYTLKAKNEANEDQISKGNSEDWENATLTTGKLYIITYSFETKALVLVP